METDTVVHCTSSTGQHTARGNRGHESLDGPYGNDLQATLA